MTKLDSQKLQSSSSSMVSPASNHSPPTHSMWEVCVLMWTEMLPPDMTCSKEAKEIIVECCVGKLPLFPASNLRDTPRGT